MRETNREQIRRALDECLSGMDGRPSLEKRVLARAKGERRGPRRLSLALAVALVFTSAPPMPRVPDGAVMVTVTGVPKAADSVSCTTILPPIKLA